MDQDAESFEDYNKPFLNFKSIICSVGTFDLDNEQDMILAFRLARNFDDDLCEIFKFLLIRSRKYNIKKSSIVSIDKIKNLCKLSTLPKKTQQ